MFFLFFFSSRRRHTRCLSDWSSDVCSSDLVSLISDDIGIKRNEFFGEYAEFVAAHLDNSLAERSEEHTSELQSLRHLVCRLLLEKKKHDAVRTALGRSHRDGGHW